MQRYERPALYSIPELQTRLQASHRSSRTRPKTELVCLAVRPSVDTTHRDLPGVPSFPHGVACMNNRAATSMLTDRRPPLGGQVPRIAHVRNIFLFEIA